MTHLIPRRTMLAGSLALGAAAALGAPATQAFASVAGKPSTKLKVDGVWGNLSENAASYAFNVDQADVRNSSSSISGIFTTAGWTKVQKWLNKYDYWKKLNIESSSQYPWFNDDLSTTSGFGTRTETALGGTVIYLSGGEMTTWGLINISDFEKGGRSIPMFQALLNGIIFRSKPVGPWFDPSSGVGVTYRSSFATWDLVPPSRYTG